MMEEKQKPNTSTQKQHLGFDALEPISVASGRPSSAGASGADVDATTCSGGVARLQHLGPSEERGGGRREEEAERGGGGRERRRSGARKGGWAGNPPSASGRGNSSIFIASRFPPSLPACCCSFLLHLHTSWEVTEGEVVCRLQREE